MTNTTTENNTDTPVDGNNVDATEDNLDDFSAKFFGGEETQQEETEQEEQNDTEETENLATPEERDEESDSDTSEQEEDTSDDDDDDDGEEGDPEDGEAKSKPKKKSRAQERISELNAKYREQERQRIALEKRLAELEANNKENKPEETPKNEPKETSTSDGPPEIDPKEKNEDGTDKYPLGEYDPQYIRDTIKATLEYEQKQREAETAKQQEERKLREAQEYMQAQWQEKVETAVQERYPDFQEKVAPLQETFQDIEPAYGEYIGNVLMDLEAGPDVLYYLAENVEEAQEIVNAGPVKATRMLERLNMQFNTSVSDDTKKKTPRISRAPEPPPVNKGSSAVKTAVAPDTDNLREFEKQFFKGG